MCSHPRLLSERLGGSRRDAAIYRDGGMAPGVPEDGVVVKHFGVTRVRARSKPYFTRARKSPRGVQPRPRAAIPTVT
jgi:hypothetical protein